MTTFVEKLELCVAERRHYGSDWSTVERYLRPFAAFADAEGVEWITVELFLRWKEQYGRAGTATWNLRLNAVRGFTRWLKIRDPRTEIPPTGLIPQRRQRPAPYIYSDGEIAQIVTEAAKLSSHRGLLGRTLATLFGLLAVSGMRIGEALGLDDVDVDLESAMLHVGNSKNREGRFIPIAECTADRLREFRSVRNRILGTVPKAFFTSERGKRLAKGTVQGNFVRLRRVIGLPERQLGTGIGRSPRIHDMRHAFATKTIIDWFQAGNDPDREMYKLSTYLGHTSPYSTYWYIESVPELMQLANERAERHFEEGEKS